MLLKLGSGGPDVLNLERVLQSMGFEGFEADGHFDEKTQNVIKYIQKSNGLIVDGKAGDKTLALIDDLYEPDKHNFTLSNYVPQEKEAEVILAPTLSKLKEVHPILQKKVAQLVSLAYNEEYYLVVTQGLRTFKEQDKLFAQRPKVTNACGGYSYHNYGIAADVAFVVKGKISWNEKLYKNIGRWATQVGLAWGGNWKFVDYPHLQLASIPSIRNLLATYNAVGGGNIGISAVWKKYV